MEYHEVYGEDVEAALRFLFNAMSPKPESNFRFQGIPRMLYMDNGAIAKSKVFQNVMKYLGVEIRTHMPNGKDRRRVTARSKGKVERPFGSIKSMQETLYHLDEPLNEAEANQKIRQFLHYYNSWPHRREPHSRMADWEANLPASGIQQMCSWERFCAFAREPEQRRVGVDAQITVDGISYNVNPDLAEEKDLPEFIVGQTLDVCSVRSTQHQTEPLKRFTEPSLVKTLEKNGVGRPSTYATIINTLIDRAYVTLKKKNLIVTELGLKVDDILFQVVPDIIDPGFTAELEKNLDEIADCQLSWEQWLINWNIRVFQPALNRGNQVIEQVVSQQLTEFDCPVCGAKLKKHQYVKDKESKVMLRCSQSCKDVAYFQSRGVFWSPKYGELSRQVKLQDSIIKDKPATKVSISEAVSKSPKLRKFL